MGFKLKPEYKNRVIGFNNSGAPLGTRNDLAILYNEAKRKNYKPHLAMFEETDDSALADLSKEKLVIDSQAPKEVPVNTSSPVPKDTQTPVLKK